MLLARGILRSRSASKLSRYLAIGTEASAAEVVVEGAQVSAMLLAIPYGIASLHANPVTLQQRIDSDR